MQTAQMLANSDVLQQLLHYNVTMRECITVIATVAFNGFFQVHWMEGPQHKMVRLMKSLCVVCLLSISTISYCDKGYELLGCQQIGHHGQGCRLDGEQVMIFNKWAAAPHELGQLEKVLQVVARLPSAYSDLEANHLRAGWPKVEGIVRSGNVHQRLDRSLVLPLGEEIHHFGDVATTGCLTHIEVIQGLLNLTACHLKRHPPGACL